MKFIAIAIIVAVLASAVCALNYDAPALDNKFIRTHNINKRSSWTASRNERFEGLTIGDIVGMMGSKKSFDTPLDTKFKPTASLPTEFDSRKQWPGCVHAVLNQGQCGSCWAFATSEALSDRLCIASHGAINVTLSPQALVSCDTYGNDGCNGGVPQLAWEYTELHGLPTFSCFPYGSANGTAPDCEKSCSDSEPYNLYRAEPFTLRTHNSVESIQEAIFSGGPVVGTMNVYQDFLTYSGGVYVMTAGSQFLGGHAIEIVGWGTDSSSGLDYWMVKNSWGTSWGLSGYFMIQRGTNMCGIDRDSSSSSAKTN